MQFYKMDNVYTVVRITGPQHNLLQFQVPSLQDSEPAQPELRELEPTTQSSPVLDRDQVGRHVCAGLARARAELGEIPGIVEIGFLLTDTKPEAIYDELAYALACHMVGDSSSSAGLVSASNEA